MSVVWCKSIYGTFIANTGSSLFHHQFSNTLPIAHQGLEDPQGMLADQIYHDGPWALSSRHLWRPMSVQGRLGSSHSHRVQLLWLPDSTWPQSGPTSLGPTVDEGGGVRNLEIRNMSVTEGRICFWMTRHHGAPKGTKSHNYGAP